MSGTIKLSMDGLRASMTDDMKELQETLKEIIDRGVLDQYEVEDLTEKFNQCACGINALNCVYSSDIESFSDIGDQYEVPLLDD